jgi:hypothetical protein
MKTLAPIEITNAASAKIVSSRLVGGSSLSSEP